MSGPFQGVCCPWATTDDVCAPCTDTETDALEDGLAAASDVLFELSGQRFPGICVAEGSMVQTEFGPKRIEQVERDESVWAWEASGAVLRRVSAVACNGERRVLKIRLRGRVLKVTPDHQLLVLRRGEYAGHNIPASWWTEWVEAQDLEPGDVLVIHGALEDAGEPQYLADGTLIDEDVAWLLGLLVGDGWLETDSVGVSGGGEPVDRAIKIMAAVWGLEAHQRSDNKWATRFFSRRLRSALELAGMRHPAHEKEVPQLIWRLSSKLQRSYLEGYLAADGHWSQPKRLWEHGSASLKLAEQTRALCMRLGDPVSNLRQQVRPPVMQSPNPKYPGTLKTTRPLWTFLSHPRRSQGQRFLRFRNAQVAIGPGFRAAKVLSIEEAGTAQVFDLTVEESHNFLAEGIVVHNCSDVVRPCGSRHHGDDLRMEGVTTRSTSTGIQVGCGCASPRACGCGGISEITLGGWPVVSVDRVMVDGVVLDPARYRVDDFRWLVRLPDEDGSHQSWPCCQSVELASDQPDTFEVTFSYGAMPPAAGVRAAAVLGCQLALACTGADGCRLPQRVTSIVRQGVSMTVLDPMDFLTDGMTGLYEIDLFLATYGPKRAKRMPAVIVNPDMGRAVRRVGT